MSAAMDVFDAPLMEVFDFSDDLVPLLRHKAHQPPETHQYHLPAFIFKLADYTPRVQNQAFNVSVHSNYDGDTEDSDHDDDPPPPRPPRGGDNDPGAGPSGSGAPLPIQV